MYEKKCLRSPLSFGAPPPSPPPKENNCENCEHIHVHMNCTRVYTVQNWFAHFIKNSLTYKIPRNVTLYVFIQFSVNRLFNHHVSFSLKF